MTKTHAIYNKEVEGLIYNTFNKTHLSYWANSDGCKQMGLNSYYVNECYYKTKV